MSFCYFYQTTGKSTQGLTKVCCTQQGGPLNGCMAASLDYRNSTYTIVDRVRIDEIIIDAAGFKSYKLPQDEANRIEWLLKGGADSDIDSDEELVENEQKDLGLQALRSWVPGPTLQSSEDLCDVVNFFCQTADSAFRSYGVSKMKTMSAGPNLRQNNYLV